MARDEVRGAAPRGTSQGPPVARWEPRSEAQARAQRAFLSSDLLFLTGPPGSGKTIAAVGLALCDVVNGRSRRKHVVALRPNVVADNDLGALPGSLDEKLAPFAAPVLEAASKCCFNAPPGLLRVESLGHSRGRTFDDCVVVVDEGQNCTRRQLLLAITRLGAGSKMIVTGDPTQADLFLEHSCDPRDTPLWRLASDLDGVPGVAWVDLPEGECHRAPVVAACLARLVTRRGGSGP